MPFLSLVVAVVYLLAPTLGLCYDVLILQSLRDKGYQEAVQGFKRECTASSRTVVLSDFVAADLTRMVREERPKLIIAVGERAHEMSIKVREIPVLYMMVITPRHRLPANHSGVGMLIDPSRYVSVLDNLGSRRIGVLFDPSRTGAYLKKAQSAARRSGMDLVVREVRSPRETPALLDSLRGRVDAIWMIPDLTAVSTATTEAFFLFSQGEMIPVVTFSDFYLTMGGAIALSIDRHDIGRQLGEMARQVLDGTPVEELPAQSPRKFTIKANNGVLKKLRLSLTVPGGS
ncbi:ABC transporter substrate-binding protein [Geomesophilobacter sediminis]|uniref:ABC transporter substrate-binding protein n=1 Tax=Geomesophilobacter sediminis TaxID=2798584 RepID=A0A8J7JKL4_9BACT|nr:ABC transporter substrate binding protein [Geomesophilobacter sediminis]MBJ6723980.1 ABC transporter substrate-binding protein [Geomesophilobacter sediminis]